MPSTQTIKCRRAFWIAAIISILLNIGPLAVYSIMAICSATLTYQKIALSFSVLVVAILTLVALINKITLKSRIWIILLGIYICLGEIMIPLVIIAACQVIDELCVCPIKNYYHTRLTINKEIDKR